MAAVSPTLLAVLTIGVIALVLGIFIGSYTIPPSMTPENEAIVKEHKRFLQNLYDPENQEDPVYQALIQKPDRKLLEKNIRLLSIKPHQAGSARDEELAQFIRTQFLEAGLDRAYLKPYKVLLSYSNPERPNKIYLIDKATDSRLMFNHQEPPLRPEEEGNVPAFHGYAPSGDIIGDPVYCNYGLVEDFELLEDQARIDLNGKICLIRYGRTFRGNKVANAERFGCSAVIMFSDPESYAPFDGRPSSVYPHSIWMNGKAMQSGSVRLQNGDPLTPGFASIIDGYHEDPTDEERVHLPRIPSQPIGYDDARMILQNMAGDSTEDNLRFQNWTGKLNVTYRIGPGFKSSTQELRMVINNELVERVVHNVIGVLDGSLEPDRYVLVGNHRDAWSYGAMDAASGGSAMLESARSFGNHHRETGWRPRRSLIWASWAAEELGLIGSTEWTEEFNKILERQAVAYINADICVDGPFFNPDSTPSLAQVVRDATKRIPAHTIDSEEEQSDPNRTLFESWMAHSKTRSQNQNDEDIPVEILSSGSDHVPFAFGLGIPSINLNFEHDKKKYPVSSYPAYHTGYETYYLVKTFIDQDFSIHQSCARLINILLYSLSCSTIIPVNFEQLAKQIQNDYNRQEMDQQIRKTLVNPEDHAEQSLSFLQKSMNLFTNATLVWQKRIQELNSSQMKPLLVKKINDQIIAVERTFTIGSGLYQDPDAKNLLYGTLSKDSYQTLLFPGANNILNDIALQHSLRIRGLRLTHEQLLQIETSIKNLKRTLRRHLNEISLAFRQATLILQAIDHLSI